MGVISWASTLSWHGVFSVEKVWIDVILFLAFVVIHTVANVESPSLNDADDAEKAQSFTLVNTLASGGITAVGILLPLSLTAVATFATKHTASSNVLVNIFIGDAWLALSLTLGLGVLWVAGFQGIRKNVQNVGVVRVFGGWQLFALLLGIVRLLIATFLLVQSPS